MAIIRWQPRHMMRPVREWSPFEGLDLFRNGFNQLFDWPFDGKFFDMADDGTWTPRVDVTEDSDRFQVRVDLPGMKKEEIQVTIDGNTLTVHGERAQEKETKDSGVYRQERFTGKFSRSLVLPAKVDAQKVEATYNDGVLQITVAKSDAAKPKQIPIQS